MEDQTFKSRLVDLLSKSRKANRLYSGVTRANKGSELAESQASEWQIVNNDLTTLLSQVLDKEAFNNSGAKTLISETLNVLDSFTAQQSGLEAEILSKKNRLIAFAEAADFVQTSILSRELVSLRARTQALQAACQELKNIIKRGRPDIDANTPRTEEPSAPEKAPAKIIQFRQKSA